MKEDKALCYICCTHIRLWGRSIQYRERDYETWSQGDKFRVTLCQTCYVRKPERAGTRSTMTLPLPVTILFPELDFRAAHVRIP